MNDSVMSETVELAIGGMSCAACVERVRSGLSKVTGIENLMVEIGRARFDYYPQAIGLGYIQEKVRSLGYTIPSEEIIRNPFTRFLARMTAANQAAFGSQPPSCCSGKKR